MGRWLPPIACAFTGALAVAGFAPLYLFPLPLAALAVLAWAGGRAPSPLRAAGLGFAFGAGFFLAGVSWVYVSLHDFGAMPAPLAAVATLLFCVFLALFPAAASYAHKRCGASAHAAGLLAFAAVWTLAEWTRGWIFTGFPWLALGYSQVPSSPLAGYAPLVGVYGVSLLGALSAVLVLKPRPWRIAVLVAIWAAGFALRQVAWTEPAGEAVSVSLLQGNIAQDMKWREDQVRATLVTYLQLVRESRSRLIVLPETALPLFEHSVPRDYLDALAQHARANHGDILIGLPEQPGPREYYNSVLSLGTAPKQVYRKSHLVPFGEFVPLGALLGPVVAALAIPLTDFSRGAPDQRPLAVAGQRVAVDVCYEDAFGEEIIRQLPQASLLVNVSNVAWFGDSIAPQQHLQISQMRALETGRYMLRATNTGMTAIVDPHGTVEQAAPAFTRTMVTGTVRGYAGETPYVRWGNAPALALAALLLGVALWLARGPGAR